MNSKHKPPSSLFFSQHLQVSSNNKPLAGRRHRTTNTRCTLSLLHTHTHARTHAHTHTLARTHVRIHKSYTSTYMIETVALCRLQVMEHWPLVLGPFPVCSWMGRGRLFHSADLSTRSHLSHGQISYLPWKTSAHLHLSPHSQTGLGPFWQVRTGTVELEVRTLDKKKATDLHRLPRGNK